MYNLNWSREDLNSQKLGTFCEYYAKMALASYGLSIYTAEVDDHGIDFVAETEQYFLKFQVKSARTINTNYIFMKEKHFDIADNHLFLILCLLEDGQHPDVYIIPTAAWHEDGNNKVFIYRSYEGKKSEPEYGIRLSKKNIPLLKEYKLENMIETITGIH